MLVVGFYTFNTHYEELAFAMKTSAEALGLKVYLKGYENRGAWVANCAIKPEFLLECLETQTDDLLYVDADALIRRVPTLCFRITDPIAAYFKQPTELLSGTLFLKNCETTKALVKEWCAEQDRRPGEWDQRTLLTAVNITGTKVFELPQRYTKIFDAECPDEPVIEHFQQSRRTRVDQRIQATKGATNEPAVKNIRIRTAADGSIYISRADAKTEAFLDKKYIRVPNELRWLPATESQYRLNDIRSFFKGKTCYIVGKGPSLDNIHKGLFRPNSPIITINEAVHRVESLKLSNDTFAIQQDAGLENRCKPERALLLVAEAASNWYADFENKLVFHMAELDLHSCLTVVVAIRLAQKFGATNLHFIAFDSCVNQSTDYAECIGYPSRKGGDVKRFLSHRMRIEREATIPITFEGE